MLASNPEATPAKPGIGKRLSEAVITVKLVTDAAELGPRTTGSTDL
jgi:hypothetical protein